MWLGAHLLVCGIYVYTLLYEAGEGGEVALLRRGAKLLLLRLWGQLFALSGSQEQGGEARCVLGRLVGARGQRYAAKGVGQRKV